MPPYRLLWRRRDSPLAVDAHFTSEELASHSGAEEAHHGVLEPYRGAVKARQTPWMLALHQ
jgi:hypothetical protein